MTSIKINPIKRNKVSFTYFLPEHAIALEYLTKYCENLRVRKVNILDEALGNLFQEENKYSKELKSTKFKQFKKQFGNKLGNKVK